MSKVMYVTVGTSLFHSASWEADDVKEHIRHYEEWISKDPLRSPEARKRTLHAESIEAVLKKALCAGDHALWAQRLARDLRDGDPSPDTLMRFSAELATIFKMREQASEFATLRDFLGSYSRIHLVSDSGTGRSGSDLQFAAANHLTCYLNQLSGNQGIAQVLPIPFLSSTSPAELLGDRTGLGLLAQHIASDLEHLSQIDLVISGGYKLYGIALSPLLRLPDVAARLLYIHEDGEHLIQIPRVLPRSTGQVRVPPGLKEKLMSLIREIGIF